MSQDRAPLILDFDSAVSDIPGAITLPMQAWQEKSASVAAGRSSRSWKPPCTRRCPAITAVCSPAAAIITTSASCC